MNELECTVDRNQREMKVKVLASKNELNGGSEIIQKVESSVAFDSKCWE